MILYIGWKYRIDSIFDKDTQLKGWSFDVSHNNRFGVEIKSANDNTPDIKPADFTVFLPFGGEWPKPDKVPGTSSKDVTTTFPSPLQQAFKQVLAAGKDMTKKTCFIDIASLNPDHSFFTEGGENSVTSALISAIDEIIDPQVQPIIRFIGDDHRDDAPGRWEQNGSWREIFETIFWDKNGNPLLKNNKNAVLCVGYYRPILTTFADGKSGNQLPQFSQMYKID